jgi:hypothetical protein
MADGSDQRWWRRWRTELVLALAVVVSYSYFYNGAQWNHNSRFNLVFAFVEPGTADTGTFRIDRFITDPAAGENTGDWALHDGHYYSNKAPGPALLAIPAYALLYYGERLLGVVPTADRPALVNAYLLHLIATVLPMALAAACFHRFMLQLTGCRGQALVLTATLAWGTLCFPFATQFWGHSTAAACVALALCAIGRDGDRWAPAAAGLAAGAAVLCEYSCGIVVVGIGLLLVARRQWRPLAWYIGGGLLPLLVHSGYHAICFGSPLAIANSFNNPIFIDDSAVGGLFGAIRGEAVYGLTLSPYRGLFVFMPVLVLAIPAALAALKPGPRRPLYLACIGSVLAFLLMNVTFNGWHGGSTMGPRYQIPVLPCYVTLMAALPAGWWRRPVQLALLAPSVLNMLVIAMITPFVHVAVPAPLARYYDGVAQMLLNGSNFLHPHAGPIRLQPAEVEAVRQLGAFNWGEWLGLRGLASLLPLLVIMAAVAVMLHRQQQYGAANNSSAAT